MVVHVTVGEIAPVDVWGCAHAAQDRRVAFG